MQEIPETAIFHIIIKKEVARWGQRISLEANQIPMLDTSNCLKFCLKFLQALRIMRVEPLDSHWLAIFKYTFVHSAWCSITNYILLTQILSHPHDILIYMECHIHVKDHQLRRSISNCLFNSIKWSILATWQVIKPFQVCFEEEKVNNMINISFTLYFGLLQRVR